MLRKLYGSLIIFFHFFKFPIAILLPIGYYLFDYPNNWILNILWVVSIILIIKDILYPIKKPKSNKIDPKLYNLDDEES